MTTQVALAGGNGRLGRIIRGVVDSLDGFEVVTVLSSVTPLEELDGADLVIDATTPQASVSIVRRAVDWGKPVLVATSGWSTERVAAIRPLATESGSGVVFIPNFSVGSVMGSALSAMAARLFESAEIVEAHRETKVDSPSGTAVRTAELIAAARLEVGPVIAPHIDQRARGQLVDGVPVHSLRRPGVYAKQEVVLGGAGESLTISHETVDPAAAYALGIRLAVPFTLRADGVVVGLENVIDLGLGV